MRIIELVPAWPPTASASITTVLRPSDEPYTAAANPAGPAPTTATSTTVSTSMSAGVPYIPVATSWTEVATIGGAPSPATTGNPTALGNCASRVRPISEPGA